MTFPTFIIPDTGGDETRRCRYCMISLAGRGIRAEICGDRVCERKRQYANERRYIDRKRLERPDRFCQRCEGLIERERNKNAIYCIECSPLAKREWKAAWYQRRKARV